MTGAQAARVAARRSANRLIADERVRQVEKWGEQNHPPEVWLAILTEELGEMAQEMLNLRNTTEQLEPAQREIVKGRLSTEAVHVAAVALQIVEFGLRREWEA